VSDAGRILSLLLCDIASLSRLSIMVSFTGSLRATPQAQLLREKPGLGVHYTTASTGQQERWVSGNLSRCELDTAQHASYDDKLLLARN